jgi:hypothetical protein
MAIRMYFPEGSVAYTRRVAGHEVETQIAAGGYLEFEARALQEFSVAGEIPTTLMDGALVLDTEGMEDNIPYARYLEVQS